MNRDHNFDTTTMTAAIGPKNTGRYLKAFNAFQAAGGFKPTWHWPAAFVTCYWLLYRKMWGWFAGYLAVFGIMHWAESTFDVAPRWGGYSIVYIVTSMVWSFVLPTVAAKWLYYRHCSKLNCRSQAISSRQEQLDWLRRRGGTSHLSAVLTLVLVTAAFVLAMATFPAVRKAIEGVPQSTSPHQSGDRLTTAG